MTTDPDDHVVNEAGERIDMYRLGRSSHQPMICGAPTEDMCRLPFGHDGECSPFNPIDTRTKRKGLEIQMEPWHYRWAIPGEPRHHPKRCVLCWVERLAIALRFAHLEED